MKFISGNIYHVYNQGNNHQQIFLGDKDYQTFLNYTERLILPHCSILAYCLMPNHFHLMLQASTSCDNVIQQGNLLLDPLTNGFRKLLSGYARIFNDEHERSGSLFRQKTKAKHLNDYDLTENQKGWTLSDYYFNCFYYIHYNPVQAGLVLSEDDWRWSSYRYYAGLEKRSVCNKDLARSLGLYHESDFSLGSARVDNEMMNSFQFKY